VGFCLKSLVTFALPLLAFTLSACHSANRSVLSPTAPAVAAGRYHSEIQATEALLPHLADRGAGLFFLSSRYARLGDSQKALSLLKECLSLHQGFDPNGSAPFDSLRSNPEFRQLLDQLHQEFPPLHHARIAFTIPQPDLFPEGLAVDPTRHLFYMGSMYRRKILKITEAGTASDFVPPNRYDLMPVGGIKVESDHSIWAATDPGEKNRSELLHFNVNGKLLERYPISSPGKHDLNDLVIRDAHEIFTTDTTGHQAVRFNRQTHTFTPLSLPRPLLYPNGITLSADQDLLYVADMFGVLCLNLRDNSAYEVTPGERNTLSGIDGLYWYKNSLIGVQYGAGVYRVIRSQLSPNGLHVTSSEVLERGTPLVSDPTTGAILGSNFYYIANTGIFNLDENTGKILDPAKLEPIHIAVLPLQRPASSLP
jgi:hypothetical protein